MKRGRRAGGGEGMMMGASIRSRRTGAMTRECWKGAMKRECLMGGEEGVMIGGSRRRMRMSRETKGMRTRNSGGASSCREWQPRRTERKHGTRTTVLPSHRGPLMKGRGSRLCEPTHTFWHAWKAKGGTAVVAAGVGRARTSSAVGKFLWRRDSDGRRGDSRARVGMMSGVEMGG